MSECKSTKSTKSMYSCLLIRCKICCGRAGGLWARSEVPGVIKELASGGLGSRAESGPTPCWTVPVEVLFLTLNPSGFKPGWMPSKEFVEGQSCRRKQRALNQVGGCCEPTRQL